jgi:hypothetical protein
VDKKEEVIEEEVIASKIGQLSKVVLKKPREDGSTGPHLIGAPQRLPCS